MTDEQKKLMGDSAIIVEIKNSDNETIFNEIIWQPSELKELEKVAGIAGEMCDRCSIAVLFYMLQQVANERIKKEID